MPNIYQQFLDMLPKTPLQVATITLVLDKAREVELPEGGKLVVRGEGTVGTKVFIRNGIIEGEAPNITTVTIDV